MKRYSLIVVLHIIGIAFLSVGVYLLVDAGLWFSALMAFLILLATQILSSSEEIFTGSFRIRRIVQDRNKKSAYLWLWTERNAALHD